MRWTDGWGRAPHRAGKLERCMLPRHSLPLTLNSLHTPHLYVRVVGAACAAAGPAVAPARRVGGAAARAVHTYRPMAARGRRLLWQALRGQRADAAA
eukprot:168023-Chlamydomonas_euryale.AAC.1